MKSLLKKSFKQKDGIIDSINTCFNNFKINTYKSILDNIIKPDFIRLDDEFQELLQYLIITNEYSYISNIFVLYFQNFYNYVNFLFYFLSSKLERLY